MLFTEHQDWEGDDHFQVDYKWLNFAYYKYWVSVGRHLLFWIDLKFWLNKDGIWRGDTERVYRDDIKYKA